MEAIRSLNQEGAKVQNQVLDSAVAFGIAAAVVASAEQTVEVVGIAVAEQIAEEQTVEAAGIAVVTSAAASAAEQTVA